MRATPRMFLMDTVVPWVINTERYLGRLGQSRGPVLCIRAWMADRLLHSSRCLRRRWRTGSGRRHTVRRVQGPRQGCMVRDIGTRYDGRRPLGCGCSGWTYTSLCRSGIQGLDTGTVGVWHHPREPADSDTGHASCVGSVNVRNYVSSPLRMVADPTLYRAHVEARETLESMSLVHHSTPLSLSVSHLLTRRISRVQSASTDSQQCRRGRTRCQGCRCSAIMSA